MTMKRFVPSTLIALVLAAGGLAAAQDHQRESREDRPKKQDGQKEDPQKKSEQDAVDLQGLATLAPQCFTSGSGATFLKVCITERGNISYFESPAGRVHVREREGYVLCSDFFATEGVHGFDAGSAQLGWADPTVSQPNGPGTLPLIITRNSFDGLVQLKQTFKVIPPEREVEITMAVKNLSASATLPDVKLNRYFDGDVDGQTSNRYDVTGHSVWGISRLSTNDYNGLMLTQAPSSVVIFSFPHIQTFEEWNPNGDSLQRARKCGGNSVFAPPSDFVGRLSTFIGDILPGQTKSVTYRYHGM
jgi:hypothetical protein